MIRDALAIVDNAGSAAPFISRVLAFAEERQAQAEIAVLTPSPYFAEALLPLGGMYVPEDVLARDDRSKVDAIAALVKEAHSKASVFGLHDDVAWLAGDVRRSRQVADLILIGGPEEWETLWLRRRVLETSILASGTPTVILAEGRSLGAVRRAVLGWKPSAEANRAVHDLVAIAAEGARVDVVVVDQELRADGGDEVCRHLDRHGLGPVLHRLEAEGMHEADVIQGFALRGAADLLVIGGFGHSRFREVCFGGVTRYLVDHAQVPVMLSH
ncbi:MAG: universal stress protein [Sphingomonas sp.]|uniref:universal stress protein n=1 Tax=Sphingomonas sp. TaxID=28214 RepID=UPI0022761A29|nr:universal stress protein [Sphingomonas sp.]MCX8475483.1 universal stress protein [Sphingomonas sp.]